MTAIRFAHACTLTLAALLGLTVAGRAAVPAGTTASAPSPLGDWKTIDDKTGRPRAIVRVYEQGGRLFAKIERSFTPGAQDRVCGVCKDERKNQPIIGLVIIRNMRFEDGEYTGGDILDPESGTVYSCKLRLDPSGSHLIVRGYLGFSWIGRSQTWERQPPG